MSEIRFCRFASTISSSLHREAPSAATATRNAFRPSVTFWMTPGAMPSRRE